MNPTMMMMAMANNRAERPKPLYTQAQREWIESIHRDTTKEVFEICGEPENASVSILDHTLSILFKCPIKVVVTLDLLANETKIKISKSGVVSRPIISWELHPRKEQTNCWSQDTNAQRTIAYWHNTDESKFAWFNWSDSNHRFTEDEEMIVRVAKCLFNSATDGGSAGYRGSRVSLSDLEAPKKSKKTA